MFQACIGGFAKRGSGCQGFGCCGNSFMLVSVVWGGVGSVKRIMDFVCLYWGWPLVYGTSMHKYDCSGGPPTSNSAHKGE